MSVHTALFRRLFLINGLVFTVGTLVLALSPATVSSPVVLTELPVLLVGLAVILAANALLVRTSLAPLGSLATLMQRVDLLHHDDRLTDGGNGDLAHLISTFNEMLDRLEAERNAASAHALAAQEGERQRIARELHDEIGQSLTVVLLGLKRVVDRAPDDLREELRGVAEGVRSSLDEVRGVARRLRPGVLSDLGLHSALTALSSEFSQASGLPVTRRVEVPHGLDGDVELVLYRIAQEGLTNVARHAAATRAELTLGQEQAGLTLRIRDNGRGGVTRDGAGIRGMRERALLVGARLTVESPPGEGTEVVLVVPA
ncbi:HAMP domain-containing sensor histidine kinase [Actinophytocola algeriensis]|uniref:histidine kinase n=1 Tax=Actinophytocola algeriensis TaxID=1768010 RepID=A0A7W7Q2N2_9PSEU|nr:histidine kinase [Actinophytocola algeriensis]MBB4905841.1 two-component system sensor histidine kinase UhpB [Actinophytocola algeriensis]MBE1472474.1 two-component system sensor histidine kinase UhpB [Actinophytocola algeriensis]